MRYKLLIWKPEANNISVISFFNKISDFSILLLLSPWYNCHTISIKERNCSQPSTDNNDPILNVELRP